MALLVKAAGRAMRPAGAARASQLAPPPASCVLLDLLAARTRDLECVMCNILSLKQERHVWFASFFIFAANLLQTRTCANMYSSTARDHNYENILNQENSINRYGSIHERVIVEYTYKSGEEICKKYLLSGSFTILPNEHQEHASTKMTSGFWLPILSPFIIS